MLTGVARGPASEAAAAAQLPALSGRTWPPIRSGGRTDRNCPTPIWAFEQLRTLLSEAADPDRRLIVAVPAGYTREQLGLLLGIAAEAGVSETGLVDAALAACALAPVPVHVMHLELHRHRVVATAVEREGRGARRARFELDGGWGWQRIEQRCIEVVAGNFVKQTRFDPLFEAQTEQLLADGVAGWLQALADQRGGADSLERGQRQSAHQIHPGAVAQRRRAVLRRRSCSSCKVRGRPARRWSCASGSACRRSRAWSNDCRS